MGWLLTSIARAGWLLAGVGLAALHVLSPGFDPSRRFLSEYVLGPHGGLMTVVFLGLGLGSASLVLACARTASFPPGRAASLWALGLWAAATLVAGLFPTDPSLPGAPRTVVGRVHDVAAITAFLSVLVAMALVGRARPNGAGRTRLQRVSLVCLSLCLALWPGLSIAGAPGYGQRAFVGLVLVWLAWLSSGSRRTRRRCQRTRTRPRACGSTSHTAARVL